MKQFRLLLGIALLFLSAAAIGQLRSFPQEAPRGYLKYDRANNKLVLNGKPIEQTTGLQIRDEANRIIFPQMVTKEMLVKYMLEGPYLSKVWIMSPYEINQPDKHKAPVRILPGTD
ncbi:MAG TPA: hypothetical protein VJU83_11605 [Burkholderiales bacterium]|nr:hypothetical protein [Burkholderiales bacterium]